MRSQGNLSFIGNFLVIEEEEEICICSIIHLQKTEDPSEFSQKQQVSVTPGMECSSSPKDCSPKGTGCCEVVTMTKAC